MAGPSAMPTQGACAPCCTFFMRSPRPREISPGMATPTTHGDSYLRKTKAPWKSPLNWVRSCLRNLLGCASVLGRLLPPRHSFLTYLAHSAFLGVVSGGRASCFGMAALLAFADRKSVG